MPRVSEGRPTEPWVPATVSVFPIGRHAVQTRPRGRGAARVEGKERVCWDVRWRVDGLDFMMRFYRSADATLWADQLREGRMRGLPFDPKLRRFALPVLPVADSDEDVETVFSWTRKYWVKKWSTLEPRARSELARYLNRARRFLVSTPPSGSDAAAVEAYFRGGSFGVRDVELDEAQREGEAWLREHSLPLSSVGREQLEAMLAHYRQSERFPGRQVAPSSERRMVADLRQCWGWAVRDDVLAANPWDKVQLRMLAASLRPTGGGRTTLAADAEMVLSPRQIRELARACVKEGSWDGQVECFVLVMGLCGLRPSEAVGLVVGDLDLPSEGTGWLTVRRSRRRVSGRYLDAEEDPEWGPLKGRELAAVRRVPIPSELVVDLREHLEEHRPKTRGHDLVFERGGKPYDLSVFAEDVWNPGRRAVLRPIAGLDPLSPLQPKLSRLRRHDLRHSACSLWLRAKVDVTVCQRWSGHKRLSVFLDIYQGLIPGREEEGVRLLEAELASALSGS